MLDDVIERGKGLAHRQPDPCEHFRVDELRDRVEHDLGDELGVDTTKVPARRALLDETLEAWGLAV